VTKADRMKNLEREKRGGAAYQNVLARGGGGGNGNRESGGRLWG